MKINCYLLTSLFVIGINSVALTSCSSSEDETDLEAKEPVEASESGEAPATKEPVAPAAKEAAPPPPSSTVAEPPAAVDPAAASQGEVAAPSQKQAPVFNATSGRRVLYVKANGTRVHESPEANSKVIGKLEKGDHILVDIDGEWARTSEGHFVAMKALSEKGIGRGKKHGIWRNPDGSTTKSAMPRKSSKTRPAKSAPAAAEASPAEAPAPAATSPAPASNDGAATEKKEEPTPSNTEE